MFIIFKNRNGMGAVSTRKEMRCKWTTPWTTLTFITEKSAFLS
jgi:hypothetical protein